MSDLIIAREEPDKELIEHKKRVERVLINDKGYNNEDIERDINLTVSIEKFTGTVEIDFIIKINEKKGCTHKVYLWLIGNKRKIGLGLCKIA